MTLKRICCMIGSSNITHNKVPAVFEDHVGAHERSQIHLGQEVILAIIGRNFTTCGNCPVSYAAPGVSALPIIQNPRGKIMYRHTSEYYLLSLMPSGR